MGPDPALFVSALQDANRKVIFLIFYAFSLLKVRTFTSFFKDKGHKEVIRQ
jgi:hypothetical protein